MYLSLFPLLHVYNGDDALFQAHECCPLEFLRAENSSYADTRLGELEAWWIHTERLMDGASASVILQEDGNHSELEEWSCWGLACERA